MNRLALRNLFRHRTRSIVTLAAIAFSTIVLALAAGFIEWIFFDLRASTIETGLGHLQISRKGYAEHGLADPYAYLLSDQAAERAAVEKAPHVLTVGDRLNVNGLLSLGDATLSFVGVGVEPAKEEVISRNLTFVSGANLAAGAKDEIVVGQGLADNLGIKVADRVVMLVNTSTGSVNAVEVVVKGVFTTQVRAFDEVALRMPIATARRLLRVTGAHVWVVALDDVEAVDATAAQLRTSLDPKRFEVFRWLDLSDFFTKTVTFLSGQLGVMRVLIAVIIVLGVSNMLIMNVLERTGEIGTLMALGLRRRQVVALFMTESFYLGVIGAMVGLLLALISGRIISAIGVPMPPPPGRTVGYLGAIRLTVPILASAVALSIGTTMLAGLYPARKASRLIIVDALRYNR